MKLLWRLSREAVRYRALYIIAILSTLALTVVNLAAPRVLSQMTGIVSNGVDRAALSRIRTLTMILICLYLLRVLFRFLSNYLAHKAAWYLVGDLRTRTYDKLEHMHLGYFHDKQTGDLMSRVVNDTRDFELLYAHMIPETITNLVTFAGVLIILLFYRNRSRYPRFRHIWLWVLLSFAFYIPVAVGAGLMPMLGMLMLPKTVCYILLLVCFLRETAKE